MFRSFSVAVAAEAFPPVFLTVLVTVFLLLQQIT